MLRDGRLYDAHACKNLGLESSESFDRWTLKAPILHLKAATTRMKEYLDLRWEDIALETFLRQSLLIYRREPNAKVHAHCIVDDFAEIAKARWSFDYNMSGRPQIDSTCVYMVVAPGASPEDLSCDKKWNHPLRLPDELERKLLRKRGM